ncbi:Protein CBG27095 [Caenorhabditis briggsae]|uniref:Protein CBG27095 n=1 Tax=Caenorhabditis briggsae TaxID=6238 RepID=B6IHH1_CAEBR|nr:Protein CBG27095 [Caenorhabditis briggsae]CAR99351.1 Protein CBG27095 [Caenorhabditis briggsae]
MDSKVCVQRQSVCGSLEPTLFTRTQPLIVSYLCFEGKRGGAWFQILRGARRTFVSVRNNSRWRKRKAKSVQERKRGGV